MTKDSEKSISTNSVNHILDDISSDKLIQNNGHLPFSFGIDDTISKLAFIIVDQDKKISLILIILECLKLFIYISLDAKDLSVIKFSLLQWIFIALL